MKYIKPLNEARPMFQETPNEFAYLDFNSWAYKNRGKIKKELKDITDSSKFFIKLSDIWKQWANKEAKEWRYLHSTDVARKDFGRALAVLLKGDDLIIKRATNKLTDLK